MTQRSRLKDAVWSMPWPARLWLVRHGQSAGNVARDAAHEAKAERIALAVRDADVPLSELGEEQSRVLGRWMANLPEEEKPDVVLFHLT